MSGLNSGGYGFDIEEGGGHNYDSSDTALQSFSDKAVISYLINLITKPVLKNHFINSSKQVPSVF